VIKGRKYTLIRCFNLFPSHRCALAMDVIYESIYDPTED